MEPKFKDKMVINYVFTENKKEEPKKETKKK